MAGTEESKQPLLGDETGKQQRRQSHHHLTLPPRSPESDDERDSVVDSDGEGEEEGGPSALRRWVAAWCTPRLPLIHRALRIAQQVLAVPLMEATGTGLLTLVVAMLSRPAAGASALTVGLAVGATIAALVYGGARISGAHYNPGVTFTLLLLRKTTPFQALIYFGAQVGGAVGGAHLARALVSPEALADPSTPTVTGRLCLLEIGFTFALCFTVLHTTLPPAQLPNSFAAYAICAVVAAGASLGASLNPAVSTGQFVAADASEGLWVRWLLPLIGALISSSLFHLTCPTAEETLLVVPGGEAAAAATAGGSAAVSEQERAYTQNVGRVSRLLGVYAMEFIGTFLLTLTVTLSLAEDNGPPAPATAGLMLSGLVYAGGYLSGGHFNCAVTLACLLYRPRAKEVPKALGYALAQLLGALIAAASVHSALGHAACARAVPVPQGSHSWGQALGAEAAFTALLTVTVLLLAAAGAQGHQFFGIAIGAALTGGLYCAGSISGGGLNPCVASALYLANAASHQVKHAWIYWLGPLFGALAAVVLTEVLSPLSGGALDALADSLAATEQGDEEAGKPQAQQDQGRGSTAAAAGGGMRAQ